MRVVLATILFCLVAASHADAHARHHGYRHIARSHHVVVASNFAEGLGVGLLHQLQSAQRNETSWPSADTMGSAYGADGSVVSHPQPHEIVVRAAAHVGAGVVGEVASALRPADCYGIPWCGCYMRHLLGVADRAYDLAANWAHWGRPAPGPAPGVVVVWRHHVGEIVGQVNGQWLVLSGNDGHAVRTRVRSLAGAIAFRV